ncbi:acyltransferase family protein [Novosphingobium sp. FSY-8]|uniref:Acyltransferase family protein n=1 Tax=Novosphingobium ovatum TaxID=1908523 RepID=A0ABW9XGE3_9SPHN|nr:acyltransferase [Novosphingobium ovatum]NBC37627.1 acyltransferase family protein [Novosphingobium ovatum]
MGVGATQTDNRAPPVSGPRQWAALTGIRGIAAWFVVLYHLRMTLVDTMPGWYIQMTARGYLAVDLFFILSGFVLWHTYGERMEGIDWAGVRQFWWRRIARIWPLHAVVLTGFVALALALAVTGRDTSSYPFADLPLHYLLMQNWGFTRVLEWNDPAWSISCEMAAYLVFPAVALVAPWRRLSVGGLIAVGAALMAAIWLYFAIQGTRKLGFDIPQLGLMRCLLEFWTGNILRMLWGHWHERPGAASAAWMALFALLVLSAALELPETLVWPPVFAALIMALALDDGPIARVLGGRVLHYLGEISYSTYLVHYLLFVVFKLAFVHHIGSNGAPAMGLGHLAGLVALIVLASVVLYHGVEKPAQGWMNALPKRWRAAGRPVVAE